MSIWIYTWSSKQQQPTLVKLDRMLFSRTWEKLYTRMVVIKLPRMHSDNNPLILDTSCDTEGKIRMFTSERNWVKHPDFMSRV